MKKLIDYINQITGNEPADELIRRFEDYYEMLVEKNKVMNLTAITEKDEVILKHFIDSLAIAEVYPGIKQKKLKVLDLGTGAGFPGIPLKLVFPQLDMTLFDSLNKRILFLQDVIGALDLKDCIAVHGRAEEAARKKEMREHIGSGCLPCRGSASFLPSIVFPLGSRAASSSLIRRRM